jgi:hypothetical protein
MIPAHASTPEKESSGDDGTPRARLLDVFLRISFDRQHGDDQAMLWEGLYLF